jgi:hypothetical protein
MREILRSETMNAAELSTLLTSILTPSLAAAASKAAAEGFAKEFGKDTWDFVKRVWAKLQPKIDADPQLSRAVKDAQEVPDQANKEVLQIRLRRTLETDSELRNELALLLERSRRGQNPSISSYIDKVQIEAQTVQGDIVVGPKVQF